MELITNILIEYLKHNKRIVVPKLGAFIVKQPTGTIVFSELIRNDDGVLRSLLLAYGVGELEANGMIDRFVFEIRHAVNTDGSIIVDNLGEFRAGANNTITFTTKREPQQFGGSIKPPVDILDKRNVKRREDKIDKQQSAIVTTLEEDKPAPRHRKKQVPESTLSSGKPEAYLRGLKYDESRNKKRNEEGLRGGNRGRKRLAIIVVAIVVVGAVIGALIWMMPEAKPNAKRTPDAVVEQSDSTLLAEPLIEGDSLNIATNGAAEASAATPTPATTSNN